MMWLAIYLYAMGSTVVWWYARKHGEKSLGSKLLVAVLWPVFMPLVALLG